MQSAGVLRAFPQREVVKVIYRNAWASSVPDSEDIVVAGRSRWKIENENNNTLKTQDYRFEHNYGEHLFDCVIDALQPAQSPPTRPASKR